MRQYTGSVLMGIGGVHTAMGVPLFRSQWRAIARDGVVDAVLPHWDRQTAVWFMLSGVAIMAWGAQVDWTQRYTGRLPPALHWQLLGLWAIGVVLMPRSGFWSLLPAALIARAGRDTDEHAG